MNSSGLLRQGTVIMGAALLVAITGFHAPMVQAAWPDTSAFANAKPLSDAEMGEMRGRFIDGNKILFFGIKMSSEWRTPTGEVLQANADLYADVAGNSPKVTFSPNITAITKETYQQLEQQSSNTNISNQGTNNASGVVQTIQAGGSHNAASNDFVIDIKTGGQRTGVSGNSGNGLSELKTASGAKLSVSNNNGSLGVSIDIPGQGRINQQILSQRGLHQTVQLSSSLQQIRNVTRLELGIQRSQLNGALDGQMRRAIESAQGLRR